MTGKENIVTTDYEHYANISPWMELERRQVAKTVRFVKFNPENGILDMTQLEEEIDQNTRVVAVTGVSNCLGLEDAGGSHHSNGQRSWCLHCA